MPDQAEQAGAEPRLAIHDPAVRAKAARIFRTALARMREQRDRMPAADAAWLTDLQALNADQADTSWRR